MDMTGRVLDAGEAVTEDRREQEGRAHLRGVWDEIPAVVRELCETHQLNYPTMVEVVLHSLLTEATQGAEKHERAAEVVEFIRSRFFDTGSE
jgi:uncharacterized protein (DUF2235 family)